jgi:hypothetical protein
MTVMNHRFPITFLLLFIIAGVCIPAPSMDTTFSIPDTIRNLQTGCIEYKVRFTDKIGEHTAIFYKDSQDDGNEKRSVALKVAQYLQTKSRFYLEWTIRDNVDCEAVDIEGNFFKSLISLTDLDGNGITETTVAYYLTCAGGIEPKLTKVIMRQGVEKYAVRGESLVHIDDKTEYGGKYSSDVKLDSKPEIKKFLIQLWKKAAGMTQ